MKRLIFILLLTVISSAEKLDFREAILNRGMRISINDREITEHQNLIFRLQPTWIIGIYHNGNWNNTVVTRDNKFHRIIDTPYKVKLNGSLTIQIDEKVKEQQKSKFAREEKKEKRSISSGIFLILLLFVMWFIMRKYLINNKGGS